MAPLARILPMLLLLVLALPVAPAAADHWSDDDPGYGDELDESGDPDDTPDVYEEDGGDWSPDSGWSDDGADGPAPDRDGWDGPGGGPDEPRFEREPVPLPTVVRGSVKGRTAKLRTNGKAAIPRNAPRRVKAILRAANQIVGKPYKWGGGHGSLFDSGYDCSGAVSYALIRSGHLGYTMVSGSFAHWGLWGAGKYVSVYANKGHVYLEVAGLRLDTSSAGDFRDLKGVRWRPVIGKRSGFAVRHLAGL